MGIRASSTLATVAGLLLLVCTPLSSALELSARGVAHSVLVRCAKDGAFADCALSSTLTKAQLAPRDARLATEITYGVLRNTRSLDFALHQLVGQLDRTSVDDLAALRMGTFELMHMRTPDHAAVSQAVETASSKRSRGFLNGVLRNMARKRDSLQQPEALGVRCSMPDWLLAELAATVLPDQAALGAWAEANQKPPRLALRVNPLRASVVEVAAALQAEGLQAEPVPGLPHALLLQAGGGEVSRLPGFAEGKWTVQDPAAQLVGLLAAPQPGQTARLGTCPAHAACTPCTRHVHTPCTSQAAAQCIQAAALCIQAAAPCIQAAAPCISGARALRGARWKEHAPG